MNLQSSLRYLARLSIKWAKEGDATAAVALKQLITKTANSKIKQSSLPESLAWLRSNLRKQEIENPEQQADRASAAMAGYSPDIVMPKEVEPIKPLPPPKPLEPWQIASDKWQRGLADYRRGTEARIDLAKGGLNPYAADISWSEPPAQPTFPSASKSPTAALPLPATEPQGGWRDTKRNWRQSKDYQGEIAARSAAYQKALNGSSASVTGKTTPATTSPANSTQRPVPKIPALPAPISAQTTTAKTPSSKPRGGSI
jgi:hypothetical protein